jgi:tellurite resistance protein TehA-like permease
LYVMVIGAITARFIMHRAALKCSLLHPMESLFFPTSILTREPRSACKP